MKRWQSLRHPSVSTGIALLAIAVVFCGGMLLCRAQSKTNKTALAQAPKPVATISAKKALYQPSRMYVGSLEPWVEANIGPQLISAFVDTVLVRPGGVVKRGAVLATLDCRTANAASRSIAMQARSIEAKQKAIADEAARTEALLQGGFASSNEAEQKTAQSDSEQAQLAATEASLVRSSLEVNDCVLRAPFDGEIATRSFDPGAFVRPSMAIVSEVDRSTIRFCGDAPEIDFNVVHPKARVRIHVLSTGKDLLAQVSRRAPSADPATRTVHFEVDLPNENHDIPVGTTGEVFIDVGDLVPATRIPILAATIRGEKASVFTIESGSAHLKTFSVLGERGGDLFLDPALSHGALVVIEGRALLEDGDNVTAKTQSEAAAP